MHPVYINGFIIIALDLAITMLIWRPPTATLADRPRLRMTGAVICSVSTLATCLLVGYYVISAYRMGWGNQVNPIGLTICIVLTPVAALFMYHVLAWLQRRVVSFADRSKSQP